MPENEELHLNSHTDTDIPAFLQNDTSTGEKPIPPHSRSPGKLWVDLQTSGAF
jgi:hypothetical protein